MARGIPATETSVPDRLLSFAEVRPDIGASLAADGADETRLEVGFSNNPQAMGSETECNQIANRFHLLSGLRQRSGVDCCSLGCSKET